MDHGSGFIAWLHASEFEPAGAPSFGFSWRVSADAGSGEQNAEVGIEVRTNYHQPMGSLRPMRGDIFQTNIGTKRERTMLVLGSRTLPTRFCPEMGITALRTKVWAERWWELEPETRMALWRSAERRGGQLVFTFKRFPAKRKPTFEQYMRRQIEF